MIPTTPLALGLGALALPALAETSTRVVHERSADVAPRASATGISAAAPRVVAGADGAALSGYVIPGTGSPAGSRADAPTSKHDGRMIAVAHVSANAMNALSGAQE
jgi:hypothetical protein